MWQHFKPTIFFLLKFVTLYLIGNVVYGLFINSYDTSPDPITQVVSTQTASMISLIGPETTVHYHRNHPATSLVCNNDKVISVYEGCNGMNTMIIFIAFIFSFGPWGKSMFWFVPLGLLTIHLMNLLRISSLFYVSKYMPSFLYFAHKYLFTAFLYLVIFVFWIWWVHMAIKKKNNAPAV